MTIKLVFPGECELGEGVCWDDTAQSLWWVDILGRRLFCGKPDSPNVQSCVESWTMPTEIGACLPKADGGRLVVLRDRVEAFYDDPLERELIWEANEPPTNRFNDAVIDPVGNLWITSMDFDGEAPTGQLWRLDPKGSASTHLSGYRILNGPVFSPDGASIYIGDTMNGQVLRASHTVGSGAVGKPTVFIDLGPFGGLSDGMAMDTEGCLWLARVTAGRISRYSPEGDELLTIPLPVPMVTSVSFGGPKLDTLYVTTGRILLSAREIDAYADSGSVFAIPTGVTGFPSNRFGEGA